MEHHWQPAPESDLGEGSDLVTLRKLSTALLPGALPSTCSISIYIHIYIITCYCLVFIDLNCYLLYDLIFWHQDIYLLLFMQQSLILPPFLTLSSSFRGASLHIYIIFHTFLVIPFSSNFPGWLNHSMVLWFIVFTTPQFIISSLLHASDLLYIPLLSFSSVSHMTNIYDLDFIMKSHFNVQKQIMLIAKLKIDILSF